MGTVNSRRKQVLCLPHKVLQFKSAIYIWWGKGRFTAVSTQNTGFILVLFTSCCVIFHTNNCEPAFAPPCRVVDCGTGYLFNLLIGHFNPFVFLL